MYFEPAADRNGTRRVVDSNGLDAQGRKVKGRWVGAIDLGRGPNGMRDRRRVVGTTKTEVTKRLRELRIQAARGTDLALRPPTVAELVREWRRKAAPLKKSPATLARLDRRLRQHVIPGVGHHRVDKLRPEDVERWLTAEAAAGQALRTIQDYRGDLRQVLAWAERRRLITWNVAATAELPPDATRSAPKRSLTRQQRDRLYEAFEGDRSGPYFVVLAELGLRPGEADALAWTDVDLDLGVVSILRAMKRADGGRPLSIGEPKTNGSRRKLRLTTLATSALVRRSAQQTTERFAVGPAWSRDERWADLVFTSEVGTPVHPSNLRRTLAAAIRRTNAAPATDGNMPMEPIPLDFTPYEVGRHTAASLLVDAGASPYQVADQLGHTTTRMLDRHYRHRISDVVDTAAAVERVRTRSGGA